jgi:hypothetical protein
MSNNELGVYLDWSYYNDVQYNNFIHGGATFFYLLGEFPFPNYWDNNYWGKARNFPKVIIGWIALVEPGVPRTLWFQFDWHPASEPYNIP